MQRRAPVASLTLLIPFLLLLVACTGEGERRVLPDLDAVDAVESWPLEVAAVPEGLDASDVPDASDELDIVEVPLLARARFRQIVDNGDAPALGAFLDAYDSPICDDGVCLFVSLVPGAQAVEVRGSFDDWVDGHAMSLLAFSDPAGRRPWALEIAMTVQPVVQYKLVADGAWILDPSNRYFRFAEFGPNSAISAPSVGRLTRLDAVASLELGEPRSLYVYLPAAYFAEPSRRFGVLYLQDGFNVFTNPGATYGSWDVDATADARMGQGLAEPLLLVGIDTANRLDEYTWCGVHVDAGDGNDFWTTPRLADYTDLLVETIVPLIDARFRTLSDRAHRGIAGSSLGGVSSFWIAWTRPDVFSRAGVFSPSTWIGEPDLGDDSACTPLRALVAEGTGPSANDLRVYLDSGDSDFDGASTYPSDSRAGTDWTRNALIAAGWQNRLEWDTDSTLSTAPVDLPPTTPPSQVPHLAWSPTPPAAYAGFGDFLGIGSDLLATVGHGHVHNEAAWKQRFDAALLFLFPGPALQP